MTAIALGMPTLRASPDATGRPSGPAGLIDRFGRTATDLRISLTDRCNLRCGYCMPPEGLDWLAPSHVLDDGEVVRLARIAVERLGITRLRFTGGEPLLRRGLEDILSAVGALRTAEGRRPATSLTTNALGLAHRAEGLARAGLDRVNVSLDTLSPERFATITHRDRWHDVIAGLDAARRAGLRPVKVNAVLLRGVNDDEPAALLAWALREGFELRFIEQMPLDAQGEWTREGMVTAEEILARLRAEFDLTPRGPRARGTAPAETWWATRDTPGRRLAGPVGVIASVTRPFCGDCDRTRLTADGAVRSCLFSTSEADLRALLRGGAGDEDIARAWRAAMWAKPAAHGVGTEGPGFARASRPMSSIGG